MCLKNIGIRHVIVLILFVGHAINQAMRTLLTVVLIAMMKDKSQVFDDPIFEWSTQRKAVILSAPYAIAVFSKIPTGYLMQYYSAHKSLFIVCLFCSILISAIPTVANYIGWMSMLVYILLIGAIDSFIWCATQVLLPRWAPPAEKARLASFVYSGTTVGLILSVFISGLLLESGLGWPSIFYTFGASGLIWSIVFYLLSADSPSAHRMISSAEKTHIESSFTRLEENVQQEFPWKAAFTSVPVYALIITKCCSKCMVTIFITQIPSYVNYILRFDIRDINFTSLISTAPHVATFLMTSVFAWLSDFALKKNVHIAVIRKTSNTISMWGVAAILIIMCSWKSADQTINMILLVLSSSLEAGLTCGIELNELDICPNFVMLFSVTTTGTKLSSFLASFVVGWIITDLENPNQWYNLFYLTAGLVFFGNLIFIIFGKAEVQPWNEVEYSKNPKEEKKFINEFEP